MNKTISIIFLLSNLNAFQAYSQTNQNISNHPYSDSEPYLAVNPLNPQNVISAWMGVSSFTRLSIMTSASIDGGTTWSVPDTIPNISQNFTAADVSIAFNNQGTAFLSFVDYKFTLDSGFIRVCKSTDLGLSWDTPVSAVSAADAPDIPVDRPWIVCDNSPGIYSGNLYIVSKSYFASPIPHHIWLTVSNDSGQSWSPISELDSLVPIGIISNIMGVPAVTSSGNLVVAYATYNPPADPIAKVICIISQDGGNSFSPHTIYNITAGSSISDTLYQASYSIHANPANASQLVFQSTSAINGDPDVFISYSSDSGLSWSPLQRINSDPIGNGKGQDMSWGSFSQSGVFALAWRDRRNGSSGSTSDFEIFGSVSTDGGASFSPNVNLSSAVSPVVSMSRGNDFLGTGLTPTHLVANWCDNRTGNHEIFFQSVSVNSILNHLPAGAIHNYAILFPNPAGSFFQIRFTNPFSGTLRVLSAEGKLLDERMIQNAISEIISTTDLLPGNYIVELTSGNFTSSRKLTIIH